jgi:hypothetical protein
MADKKIYAIEELDKARAAGVNGAAQGAQPTNYNEWSDTLKELAEKGLKGTGSIDGDKKLLQKANKAVDNYEKEMQVQVEQQKQTAFKGQEEKKEAKETPSDQKVKETFASAQSSVITADAMKYYHLT